MCDKVEGCLVLSAEATRVLREWEAEVEVQLGIGGELEAIRDWGSKLVGATLRIAASLHAAKHAFDGPLNTPISATTARAAVKVARYAIPHAAVALNLMDAGSVKVEGDARYALRWIENVHGRQEFSKRDLHQACKARFKKITDTQHALRELIDRNYIRPVAAGPARPGRPPSPKYEVNPALHEVISGNSRTHNSHNPTMDQPAASFGNIEDVAAENFAPNASPPADPESDDREEFFL